MGCDSQFDGLYDYKVKDPFEDEWYRLGFTKTGGSYGVGSVKFECQGCFCVTVSWKQHHEVCSLAVVREKQVTTTPVVRKK